MDTVAYLLVRGIIAVLHLFPVPLRVRLVSTLLRALVVCAPSFRRVSFKNLALVFPEESLEFHRRVYRASFDNLARVFVDFARLPSLDARWVEAHIECPSLPLLREIKERHGGKGIVIGTGHLGSFELLAHFAAMKGLPASFIVRHFRLPKLDAWWTANRERYGNRVIQRKGAVAEVLRYLALGVDAALLFDQNVTRKHALFVPWFGRPAATAVTLGLAAVRTEAPVVVSSIRYLGDDRYRVELEEIQVADIYGNEGLSTDEKMVEVTRRATVAFEKMIKAYPEGWFWMHRRWKTTPEGVPEDFYSLGS